MLPQEIIRRKRDRRTLTEAEIGFFVAGIADGSIGDGQMAAFAMAVLLNGLDAIERVALTRAMARSGVTLDWSRENLNGPVLDKHSTGGVGDKVSLILAPMVAACGGFVPMISGRGLGHTGGTLDKMDSIPGYRSQPDLVALRRVVKETGVAIIGATAELAPADRRLYAVRDVTGTVESIDLITASILSKKLAAGLDALVMDVKFGSGAFLPGHAEAAALADSLVATAHDSDLRIVALLTDMNQVLGRCAGNGVELAEAIAVLRNDAADPRLLGVTLALTAELLHLGGLAASLEEGGEMALGVLADGSAAERFGRMARALGGPGDLIEQPSRYLPVAPVATAVEPAQAGFVTAVEVRAVGLAILTLGGGRTSAGQAIDHAVGLTEVAGLGERVGGGDGPLAVIHARTEADAARAAQSLRAAFTIGSDATGPLVGSPLIAERVAP